MTAADLASLVSTRTTPPHRFTSWRLFTFILRIITRASYAHNYIVQLLLSLLPRGKPAFVVHAPRPGFAPAIVITGTSSGMGHETALRLATAGYTVFAGVRKPDDGKIIEAKHSAAARGNVRAGKLIPIIIDVTDQASVDAAVVTVSDYINDRGIPLAGVVNNAGIVDNKPMDYADPDESAQEIMAVNFFGALRVGQAFMPLLRRDKGRLVNITSIMHWLLGPGHGIYCASKAALAQATNCWRAEAAQFGVAVVGVEPGGIYTELWNKMAFRIEEHEREAARLRAAGQLDNPVLLYDRNIMIKKKTLYSLKDMAFPAVAVSDAVEHALLAPWPKYVYRAGHDAYLLSFITGLLGQPAFEWVVRLTGSMGY
ncbi:NAD(P)-binding protein [Ramicandelaber brevisporus]|nr:NAD(P)-binding protein [Ramicandelaber brevisporus]